MDDCKITETETQMEDGSISVHAVCENATVRTEMTYLVSAAELRACRDVEGTLALTARQDRIRAELREAVRTASAPAIAVLVPAASEITDAARAARVLEGVTIQVQRTSEVPAPTLAQVDAAYDNLTPEQLHAPGGPHGEPVSVVEPAPKLPE